MPPETNDTTNGTSDAYKKELASMLAPTPEPEAPAATPPPADDADASDEMDGSLAESLEEAGETGEEAADEEAPSAPDGEVEEEEKPPKPEAYSKALLALQKREREVHQFKSQVLAKERELGQREQQQQRAEGELGEFVASLRRDPFGTLMKHQLLAEDDVDFVARQLFLHSKEGQKDPRSRAEAERLQRERARDMESRKALTEVDAIKAQLAAQQQQALAQQESARYIAVLDATTEAYKAKSQLLAGALAKNPEKVRREMRQIAHDISTRSGDWADPKAVISAWNKQRKELLEELGIKADGVKSPAAEKAKSSSPAAKQGEKKQETPTSPDAYKKELEQMLRAARGED